MSLKDFLQVSFLMQIDFAKMDVKGSSTPRTITVAVTTLMNDKVL